MPTNTLLTNYLLKTINWNGQDIGYDLLMINDRDRNQFFEAGLANVEGATILDIGAGTGILSAMAVAHGAKKVIAFERDVRKYELARHFVESAGLSEKIQLVCSDILHVDRHSWPHDKIDFVISETFTNDCFIETFAFLVDHVQKNFNLSESCAWIPDTIYLKMSLVDVPPTREFDPGVAVPEGFRKQVEDAIGIYRDNFYHPHDSLNLPVAYLAPARVGDAGQSEMITIDQYSVHNALKNQIDNAKYHVKFDHSKFCNPYIKIDWVLETHGNEFYMNRAPSWKSIAFKVDKTKSNDFYFRFNTYSHALIGTQLPC
jgi:predicted RNA methylase